MLLSFNWLKQHVKLPDSISAEEVAEKLKLSTVEVEGIQHQGQHLENIVVGKVISCEKHPNADKLKVCQVNLGNETAIIVCGGSNVEEGMLTAVAKVGAKVKWHGEGELVELKPTSIRGVESDGMICASDEIGLLEMFPKKEEKEILDLSSTANRAYINTPLRPGEPLASAFGLTDAVLEIDNKSLSNRPDLWGHYGMAREAAALFNRNVETYETKVVKLSSNQVIKLKVEVEDAKLCHRYMAVAVSGIKIGESPEWLKQKLLAVGLRPINNIVDITNFVMLDIGEPMHAFDGRQVSDAGGRIKIIVRHAKEGEQFITLDEKKHQLDSSMLVIATDPPAGGKAVALAGVMGGLESGINSDTTTIVFEAANFDAATTRKTATKLGMRTDSSARFEKSLDPNMCGVAIHKAIELTLAFCHGAKVASKIVDIGKPRLFTGPLEIPVEFFAKKLGVEIPVKTIISILERLGFGVTIGRGRRSAPPTLMVKIPTWRATKDIAIPEDVVEEVARIYGYDNISATLPTFPITPPEINKLRQLEYGVTEILVRELGFTEVYNYSFVSEAQILKFGDDITRYLELDNPLSKERPYLRRHLLNNLLENIKQNSARYGRLKLCEIGKVYHPEEAGERAEINGDELLPRQDTWLTAVYADKENDNPFWEARRAAEAVAENLKINWQIIPAGEKAKPSQHPARTALIKFGDHKLGAISELHPAVAAALGIEERVGVFTLNLSLVAEYVDRSSSQERYQRLSPYPEVIRDIAFLVKKEMTHAAILNAIKHADPLLTKVELFDVFMGEGIGEGYKSMAYHLTYASPEDTLTAEEVDSAQRKVEKALQVKFGAEIRK